jgi:hypothetical protein
MPRVPDLVGKYRRAKPSRQFQPTIVVRTRLATSRGHKTRDQARVAAARQQQTGHTQRSDYNKPSSEGARQTHETPPQRRGANSSRILLHPSVLILISGNDKSPSPRAAPPAWLEFANTILIAHHYWFV